MLSARTRATSTCGTNTPCRWNASRALSARGAKELGFRDEQYLPSLQINKFGNTYSGCSLVGLAAVLDIAKPDERILVASYGSGAGSDAYLLRTTSQLLDKRKRQKINVKFQAENPFVEYVDYVTYRRLKLGM